MRNFREYTVWIDGMQLVMDMYDLVDKFPANEKYSLSSQVIKSVISIPSNIAEGASRESEKDFARFLEIALGSAFELETQTIIASKRKYIDENNSDETIKKIISLQKRIYTFRKKVLNKK